MMHLMECRMILIRRMLKFIASVSLALFIVLSVPLLVMAGLLLIHAETCAGRLFAVAVILGLPALVMLWISSFLKRKRRTFMVAAIMGGMAIGLLCIDYGLTPNGLSMSGSAVHSCFKGTSAYQRASMANLVPEMDQLILATYVVPALDSLKDRRNTMEMRTQVRAIYGEMQQSPEFECLGSVLNQTYQDLFLGAAPTGHFYEYIPDGSRQPLPVVIFLHGSLGNFRGYLWVWQRIADQYGFAVVAPTFGAGNWDDEGGEDAIEQVRRYCAHHPRLDPARIYLAGLSNGGRGVCLGARRSPDAYRGLIFISPILEPEVLLSREFVASWKDKPILILHGTDDNRIPIDYIREGVETLERRGMRVDREFYEGQTHFLFFTIRDKVRTRIGEWLLKR